MNKFSNKRNLRIVILAMIIAFQFGLAANATAYINKNAQFSDPLKLQPPPKNVAPNISGNANFTAKNAPPKTDNAGNLLNNQNANNQNPGADNGASGENSSGSLSVWQIIIIAILLSAIIFFALKKRKGEISPL